ncbi:hypothetical protein MBM_08756 [Drepanopeziza brunnea f. sp. 'multigermtubi' MB_m1]|uniref:Uncharacterized protein n=2 Tax=Drepanopeziza brunnea f. sp. 'multigermtubi' TaxID=698441 RepID=K1XKJ8_MARBU|nr:uncharacterized protein MBM_08756 [Drepanopeziza brunnea f. sp. 'multigermtubi' MB_m1]EKD12994.1 hypothetical protein MBM_08756 [Drepanopeziza brunnea f. sp. 'multigermtubi' MB_m1]
MHLSIKPTNSEWSLGPHGADVSFISKSPAKYLPSPDSTHQASKSQRYNHGQKQQQPTLPCNGRASTPTSNDPLDIEKAAASRRMEIILAESIEKIWQQDQDSVARVNQGRARAMCETQNLASESVAKLNNQGFETMERAKREDRESEARVLRLNGESKARIARENGESKARISNETKESAARIEAIQEASESRRPHEKTKPDS